MTEFDRIQARNASFEAMLKAQALMDEAVSSLEKDLARSLYNAHRALWLILSDKDRKGKQ